MNTRILIAMPTNRGVNPKTLQCLFELIEYNKDKYDLEVIVPEEGYTIAENRNYIGVQALQSGAEYLLMLDDDMTFKPELLEKLVSNNKDICGVAYHPRSETAKITKYLDEVHCVVLDNNKDPKYKDVFECHATGTGIILIKCDVFKKVPQPWFEFEYHKNGCCKVGEDWHFCIKAKKHGIKTWTDPTVYVGHLGEKIYEVL